MNVKEVMISGLVSKPSEWIIISLNDILYKTKNTQVTTSFDQLKTAQVSLGNSKH